MIAAIVQARTGSTRLKGKVLADLEGKPMIQRVLERVSQATLIDATILATTWLPEDDPLADLAQSLGYPCYRGHPTDVLDRYYQAAELFGIRQIVRVTGDCPLVTSAMIDGTVDTLLTTPADYVGSGVGLTTFPDGIDVEAFKFSTLWTAWKEATLPSDREHVTPYIWRNWQRFRTAALVLVTSNRQGERWSVDTAADLEFVRAIYRHMGRDLFSMSDVFDLLRAHPELREINQGIERNAGYALSVEREREMVST